MVMVNMIKIMRSLSKVFSLAVMSLLLTACPDKWDEDLGCPKLVVHNNTKDTVYMWKQDLFINGTRSMVLKSYAIMPDERMYYVYRGDKSWEQVFSLNSAQSVKEIHLYTSKDSVDYTRWMKDYSFTLDKAQMRILTYDDFKDSNSNIHEISLEE